MILTKKIEPVLDKRGFKVKCGLFLCPFCLQKVEKFLNNGLRDKSCGCVRYKLSSEMNSIHGETKTRLYKKWCKIISRCFSKNDILYKNYGGRGITICHSWAESYIKFRNWSLNNGY